MSGECSVCVFKFDRRGHRDASCPYCGYACCSACAGKYILELEVDPRCMNCKRGWSREWMCEKISCKFVTVDYKKRREQLIFEREKSLLPATQEQAEREKRMERNLQLAKQAKIKYEMSTGSDLLQRIHLQRWKRLERGDDWREVERQCQERLDFYEARKEQRLLNQDLIRDFEREIERMHTERIADPQRHLCLSRSIDRLRFGESPQELQEDDVGPLGHLEQNVEIHQPKKKLMLACPLEECRGFVDESWVCGMCESKVCRKCHEVVFESHECREDDVETAKLLAKDSKACPKCAVMIFKIAGCDQMYCTQCHSSFSWKTLEILNARVHNPHYYDYVLQTGGDCDECCEAPHGLPYVAQVSQTLSQDPMRDQVLELHRKLLHLQAVIQPKYLLDGVDVNKDLRVKYLLGLLSDSSFKVQVQRRDKKRAKYQEIHGLMDMLITVASDIFSSRASGEQMIRDLHQIRKYYNQCMEKIRLAYQCVGARLDTNFDIIQGV